MINAASAETSVGTYAQTKPIQTANQPATKKPAIGKPASYANVVMKFGIRLRGLSFLKDLMKKKSLISGPH